jgi:hypothetical protein
LIPTPTTTGRMGSPPLRDRDLLAWARGVLEALELVAPPVTAVSA